MNPRATYGLLGLFFAGLLLLWWAEYRGVPTEAERLALSELVFPGLADARPTDVSRVEIEGSGATVVLDRREDGSWQLSSPLDAAAEGMAVEAFVRDVGTLRRLPGSGLLEEAPARYGLDAPGKVVRLFGSDRSRPLATLQLGRVSEGRRYVRGGAEAPIRVVDATRVAAADKAAVDWRERRLFEGASFDVERVAVTGPGRDLVLQREGGRWRLARPFLAPVPDPKADGLIADLLDLRADDRGGFAADDVTDFAPYGLDAPRLTIEVRARLGAMPRSVQIGSPGPAAEDGSPSGLSYARRSDQDDVFLVRDERIRDLGTSVEPLRGPLVSDIEPARVGAIRLTIDGRVHEVVRVADGWRQLRPEAAGADAATVQALLVALDGLKATAILEPEQAGPSAGLDPPAMTLEVWEGATRGGVVPDVPPDLRLALGRRDTPRKVAYARFPGDSKVLAVPESTLEAIPVGPHAFRDRRIVNDDPRRVRRVRVARPDGTFVAEREGDAAPWRLTEPVDAPGDAPALDRLVQALCTLRAERFLDGPAGSAPPGGAEFEVSWTLAAPDAPAESAEKVTRTLKIGRAPRGRSDGPRPATLFELTEPVLIPEAFLRAIDVELRDRRVQTFDPGRLERLELEWPDRSLAFVRTGRVQAGVPEWTPAPGTDPTGFDASRLGPLSVDLSRLVTIRYVQHAGPFDRSLGLSPPLVAVRAFLRGEEVPRVVRIGTPVLEGAYRGNFLATAEPGEAGAVFLLPGAGWAPVATAPRRAGDLPDSVFAPAEEPATP